MYDVNDKVSSMSEQQLYEYLQALKDKKAALEKEGNINSNQADRNKLNFINSQIFRVEGLIDIKERDCEDQMGLKV